MWLKLKAIVVIVELKLKLLTYLLICHLSLIKFRTLFGTHEKYICQARLCSSLALYSARSENAYDK